MASVADLEAIAGSVCTVSVLVGPRGEFSLLNVYPGRSEGFTEEEHAAYRRSVALGMARFSHACKAAALDAETASVLARRALAATDREEAKRTLHQAALAYRRAAFRRMRIVSAVVLAAKNALPKRIPVYDRAQDDLPASIAMDVVLAARETIEEVAARHGLV